MRMKIKKYMTFFMKPFIATSFRLKSLSEASSHGTLNKPASCWLFYASNSTAERMSLGLLSMYFCVTASDL